MGSDEGGRRRFFSAPVSRGVRFRSTATPNDRESPRSSADANSFSNTTSSSRNNNNSNTTSTTTTAIDWLDRLWGIASACIACWIIVGVLTILVFLSFTVRPFSQATYRRLAAAWAANTFLDAVSLLLPKCTVCLTADSDVPSPVGSSVVLANHVTEADWWALFLLGRCVGLKGSLKVFLRNEYLRLNLQDMNGNNTTTSSSSSGAGGGGGNLNGDNTIHNNNHHNNNNGASNNGSNGHVTNGNGTSSSSSLISNMNGYHNTSSSSSSSSTPTEQNTVPDLALMAKLLHLFLDFPIINEDFTSDREQLFQLLRSFGPTDNVHMLFYPEGWCIHNGDRTHVHQKSNQFAQREGKPALQHLLLPRARGFHASLECLRETAPVVYDVTMAYDGYDGSLPHQREQRLSLPTLWKILRREFPREVHLRIKRYSMEEVLQDSNWLFQMWAEKDRRLSHFACHQSFPMDSRYARMRVFDTRNHTLETAIVALLRLLVVPCVIPLVLLLAVPLVCVVCWIWWAQFWYNRWMDQKEHDDEEEEEVRVTSRTPGGSAAAPDTPFLPTTPFVSPSPFAWRDMFNTPGTSGGGNDRTR